MTLTLRAYSPSQAVQSIGSTAHNHKAVKFYGRSGLLRDIFCSWSTTSWCALLLSANHAQEDIFEKLLFSRSEIGL